MKNGFALIINLQVSMYEVRWNGPTHTVCDFLYRQDTDLNTSFSWCKCGLSNTLTSSQSPGTQISFGPNGLYVNQCLSFNMVAPYSFDVLCLTKW